MTPEQSDFPGDESRRHAGRALQDAFRELTIQFRSFYVQAAASASPGMLPGTFKLLTAVSRVGPVSQSVLTDRLNADAGMISRQISELESLGMVARTPNPKDGRVRMIEVTPHGQERIAVAQEPYEEILMTTLEGWPVEQIDNLTSLIHALATGFATATTDDPCTKD